MKSKSEKNENKPADKKSVLFHIELPADIALALEADAERQGRSRRAHAAYLLAQIVERGGDEFLHPRRPEGAASLI